MDRLMNWFRGIWDTITIKLHLNSQKQVEYTKNQNSNQQDQTQEQNKGESKIELEVEIKLKEDKTKSDNTSTPKEEKKENQPSGQTKPLVVKQTKPPVVKQEDDVKGWNGQISTSLVLVFWLLVWAIIAIPAMCMMDWPNIPKLVTWLIVLASGALTASLGYFLTYELAKRSIFVTMVPEMSAIAITYWKKLERFYIAVSDERKSDFFEKLCELKNGECGYKKFIFLKPGKSGLCWIGFPPANHIYEWTEIEGGEEKKRALSLAETPISFSMQKDKDGGEKVDNENNKNGICVPNVTTIDGIEVSAEFTFYFWVLDTEKGLFGVKNRTSALAELAFAAWRKVVGDLEYYTEKEAEDGKSKKDPTNKIDKKGTNGGDEGKQKIIEPEKIFTINSEILKLAELKLQEELGLIVKNPESKNITNKDDYELLKKEIKNAESVDDLLKIMIGDRDLEGIAVKIFLLDWGMLLRKVAITDLEPTDPDIKLSIKDILKAKVKAKKIETEARGAMEATILKGAGEARAIGAKGAAYAGPGGNFVAAGDIAEKLPKNTTLVSNDIGTVIGALLPKILGNKSNQDEPSIKKEEPVKETKKEPVEESKEKPKEEKKEEGSGN